MPQKFRKLTLFVKKYWHYDNITKMSEKNLSKAIVNEQINRDYVKASQKRNKYTRVPKTAYAGLDAPLYQSGMFESQKRSISKRGSSLLRKLGFTAMTCLKATKPKDDKIYEFMLKKIGEGKPIKVAKIAALNKFLRVYYARVKEVYAKN